MDTPVLWHLQLILYCAVIGLFAGVVYDIFRTVRRIFDYAAVTWLSDLLYWIICTICLFAVGFGIGGGQQRIAITVFAFIAGGIYFAFFSKYVLVLLDKISGLISRLLHKLSVPVIIAVNFIKKICKNIKSVFHYNKKWFKIGIPYKKYGKVPTRNTDGGNFHEEKTFRYSYEAAASGNNRLRRHESYNNGRQNKRGFKQEN